MEGGAGFAIGMACGMGSGISCGIASGMASGRKKAIEDLRLYAEKQGITLQDRTGRDVPLEEFLEQQAVNDSPRRRKVIMVIALLLGLVVFTGLLFLYLAR